MDEKLPQEAIFFRILDPQGTRVPKGALVEFAGFDRSFDGSTFTEFPIRQGAIGYSLSGLRCRIAYNQRRHLNQGADDGAWWFGLNDLEPVTEAARLFAAGYA